MKAPQPRDIENHNSSLGLSLALRIPCFLALWFHTSQMACHSCISEAFGRSLAARLHGIREVS